MKKILSIILLFVSLNSISQGFPIQQNLGSPSTLIDVKGGIRPSVGFINTPYADTTAANAVSYLKTYPGAQIRTITPANTLWVRNADATGWIQIGSGTSSFVNPMTTLGDIIYEDATPAPARLPGNTTIIKKVLTSTGTGAISAVPVYDTAALLSHTTDAAGYFVLSSGDGINYYTSQPGLGLNIVSGRVGGDSSYWVTQGTTQLIPGQKIFTGSNTIFYQNNVSGGIQVTFQNNGSNSALKIGTLGLLGSAGSGITGWPNAFLFENEADGGIVLSAYGGGGVGSIKMMHGTGRIIKQRFGILGAKFGDNTDATAVVHLTAGSVTASTAPLKFTTGASLTTAEVGAMEYTTDDLFFTISTGTARKRFLFADPVGGLTSGRVPFATTNGRLTDAASLSFSTSTLTIGSAGATIGALALTGSTSGTISIQGQAAAGTYNFNLPTSAGTSGQPLLSGGGAGAAQTYGTLGIAAGGTNITTYTTGDLLYASATNVLSKLGIGTSGDVLRVVAGLPTWQALTNLLSSGSFTPTITSTTNVASSTGARGFFTRSINVIDGTVTVQITPTAPATLTSFNIDIPIASNFTTGLEGAGSTIPDGISGEKITLDVTNDKITGNFTSIGTSAVWVTLHFKYTVQ
jgi:hypothetical protein